MKRLLKIFSLIVAIMMLLSAFVSCGNSAEDSENQRTVMQIGEFEVPYEQFRYFYMNFKNVYDNGDESVWNGDGAYELEKKLNESVMDALKGVYALLGLCKQYGIGVNDSDISESVKETVEGTIDAYGSKNAYAKALNENYMTESVYKFLTAIDLCESKLYRHFVENNIIDTSDNTVEAKLKGNDFVRTVHIFVKNDSGDNIDDNRVTAQELLDKVKSGENFDTLIAKYSEDVLMTPDGYYFTHLEMIEEYENAAFALGIGEVSEIVETGEGFYIIKRLDKEDAYIEKHFEELKTKYITNAFYTMLNEAENKLNVTTTELYKSFNIKNMK